MPWHIEIQVIELNSVKYQFQRYLLKLNDSNTKKKYIIKSSFVTASNCISGIKIYIKYVPATNKEN